MVPTEASWWNILYIFDELGYFNWIMNQFRKTILENVQV